MSYIKLPLSHAPLPRQTTPLVRPRSRKRRVWSWHLLAFVEIVEHPPAARGVSQLMYVG
jgi:hypothetical protein